MIELLINKSLGNLLVQIYLPLSKNIVDIRLAQTNKKKTLNIYLLYFLATEYKDRTVINVKSLYFHLI